ncbi:MAG: alpha/beta hydrolase [Candidatus Hydrogenedentes bacterium]|nr:alpha/beta hydrolase [Candidatus Hydrogenedentota bacterium]
MRRVLRVSLVLLALVTAVLAAVAAYPFLVAGTETLVLDDTARTALTASRGLAFAQLNDGYTHYVWSGPADGQPVVLVHGYTGPMRLWEGTAKALADGGFRVLRYDLFGRGYSDRPDARYDADFFDRQLLELLDAQQVTGPANLVGHSMGGAIVVGFVDRHPERVWSYVLMAPAGFPLHEPLRYRMLHWPGVGEWSMRMFGDATLVRALDRMGVPENDPYRRDYVEQMRYRGYKRALLATLRHMPLLTLEPVYRRAGASGKPAMLLWGTKDHVLPFDHHKRVRAAMPGIEFYAIEDADHTMQLEQPGVVHALLAGFLSRVNGGSYIAPAGGRSSTTAAVP